MGDKTLTVCRKCGKKFPILDCTCEIRILNDDNVEWQASQLLCDECTVYLKRFLEVKCKDCHKIKKFKDASSQIRFNLSEPDKEKRFLCFLCTNGLKIWLGKGFGHIPAGY